MATDQKGLHDFAFQTGNWAVRHRQLQERMIGSDDWIEFSGTCRAWELLNGAGNVDDHWIEKPSSPYAAATVRRLEPDGKWSIWWIDSRTGGLDSPLSGTFDHGIGTFYGKDSFAGRPIDVRFIWTTGDASFCRWEQAFSSDGGQFWETNWSMEFSRIG